MGQSHDDIIEIDGQRYIVPTRLIGEELVLVPDRKIKIPIKITNNIHFTRASTEIIKSEPLNST
jgi:hypothetical protein